MINKILVASLIAMGATVAMANEIEGCAAQNNSVRALSLTTQRTDEQKNNAINGLIECAEKGDSESLELAGIIFWNGEFVKKDEKRAVGYLAKAGSQGNWDAVVIMAAINADQKSKSSAEYDKSVAALSKSIDLVDNCSNNGNYAFELARLYNDHPNYISDYKKAVYYYRIAERYFSIPPSKAPERLEELKKEAPEVFEAEENEFKDQLTKAKKGSLEAMYRVGFAYEKGYGVEKNVPEAVNWYKKSMKYKLSPVRWAHAVLLPEMMPFYKEEMKIGIEKYSAKGERKDEIEKLLKFYEVEQEKYREKMKPQVIKIYKDAADRLNDTDSMINYWTFLDDKLNRTEYLEKAANAGNMLAQDLLSRVNIYNQKIKEGKPTYLSACGAIIKNPFYDVY